MSCFITRASRTLLVCTLLLPCICFQTGQKALAEEDNPYAKTFDDFEWNENEERIPIAGAVDVGAKLPTLAVISWLEEKVENNPEDVSSLSMLGQLYFRHAKEADDLPFYSKAAKTLEEAVRIQPEYLTPKIHLAAVLASQHRFKEGLDLVTEVLARDSELPLALAVAFDCQLELGRYEVAKTTLDNLLELEQSAPVQARAARYAELMGDTDKAISLLKRSIADLEAREVSAKDTNWYRWRIAELLLSRGELAQASPWLNDVLAVDASDSAALFSLVEVQRANGDKDAAIKTTQKIIDLYNAPPAMALMGDIYAEAGDHATAETWFNKTEAAMREEMVVAGDAHAREVALFFADHDRNLPEALTLAEKDLERRQDIYSFDTLAWCQLKNGKTTEAVESMRKSLKLGTQDANLFYHAGQILAAAGENAESEAMLARAKKLNPLVQ
jgi:tetratricopeptide (TPR) repeat protein